MSHYLREHLDAVGELPQKLRETMSSIGVLDDRVQSIAALIDNDVGEVARARQRYYAQFDGSCSSNDDEGTPPSTTAAKKSRTKKGTKKARPSTRTAASEEGPVPDGWRTPEIRALEDQINSRVDLVLRMADEKWRLAQHAYDRLDVNIRRLDADLGRMETDLRRQGLLPPRDVPTPSRKRRRAGGAEKPDEPESDWLGLSLSERDDLPVDPNEPVYCVCMQVSYGEMVGCDNPSCDNGEWFHFGCVKLTKRPPGRWLCPGCTAQRRQSRRGGGGGASPSAKADPVTPWSVVN
ncbi:unnamed protein product [Scytosiphon promiscuus]